MSGKSRTFQSVRNSGVALFMFFINFILQFYSRKVFLDFLGADILGLNTTAQNLLQFLNIAELGISSAVGFTLFKPIHDSDYKTINEILALQKYLYRQVAYLVIAGSIVLMAFFPLIFAKMELPLWYAYGSFGVLLLSALLGYFVNYKQVILTASQNDYLVQLSYKSILMAKLLVQIYAVSHFNNGYIWWLVLEATFAILSSVSLHITTIRKCKYLTHVDKSFRELRQSYAEFTTKIKQMFFHQIGGIVLQQSSPLIIYAYAALSTVTLYGNYYMVILGFTSLMGAISNSMGAAVGNLVAEGNKTKIIHVFWELFSIRFFIIAILCFCAYKLIPPFIVLWIGEGYLLPETTLILLIIILYIQLNRYLITSYLSAYALTRDIWAPIIEATINIVGSIILGRYWGLNGILFAVVLSLLIMVEGWKPVFLMREGMIYPISQYALKYLLHLLIAAAAFIIDNLIIGHLQYKVEISASWTSFIIDSLVTASIFSLILFGLMFLCMNSFRQFFRRLIKIAHP